MTAPLTETNPTIRGQRLSAGKCPDHGTVLIHKEPMVEAGLAVGKIYRCPDANCAYTFEARNGSRMLKLLK